MPKGVPKAPYHERWLKRIIKCPAPRPELGECWIWTGNVGNHGYGVVTPEGQGIRVLAHRYSHEHYHGVIPEGYDVAHSCDVRLCVNPEHLSAKTRQGNVDDMKERGEQKFNSKITDEKVMEIRRLLSEGHRVKDIAAQYDVVRQTISRIKKNRTHCWVA